MKNKRIYTCAINYALRAVYSAFHETAKRHKERDVAMRIHWILPNRDQEDDILAGDGEKTIPVQRGSRS